MICYIDGDLLESPAKVLVNTVNTVGVMGKGIALRFKRVYPEMFKAYRGYCEQGQLAVGRLHLYKTRHKWILNFPTKKHWRQPSRVEYIESGLRTFADSYAERGITNIAFPALGCGNGELDFESQVKPLMERYLGSLSIPTFIYLGRRRVHAPEHKDANRIAEWLRSEPAALPFDEVWLDITNILDRRSTFKTPVKGNTFTAHSTKHPPLITVRSTGRTSRIVADEIRQFWQQLRDFGFTYSSIASEHRRFSYLMPIFQELPYVYAVKVSASTALFKTNPSAGLQGVPPPLTDEQTTRSLFTHMVDGA